MYVLILNFSQNLMSLFLIILVSLQLNNVRLIYFFTRDFAQNNQTKCYK